MEEEEEWQLLARAGPTHLLKRKRLFQRLQLVVDVVLGQSSRGGSEGVRE